MDILKEYNEVHEAWVRAWALGKPYAQVSVLMGKLADAKLKLIDELIAYGAELAKAAFREAACSSQETKCSEPEPSASLSEYYNRG